MNNLGMKSEVRRMLGNLQTSHPMVVAGDDQAWVNRGVSDVVLMGIQGLKQGIDLFPELRTTWTSDLTVNSINNQQLPADKLIVTSVASFDSNAVVNLNTQRVLPVNYVKPEVFEVITKDSTRTGFPRIWTMEGRSIKYHPTPSSSPTDYRTYLRYFGIQKDPYPDMSADADTPVIAAQWHGACVLRAAAHGARALGWFDAAKEWDAECKNILGLSTDIGANEDGMQSVTIGVDFLVDRIGVYGN